MKLKTATVLLASAAALLWWTLDQGQSGDSTSVTGQAATPQQTGAAQASSAKLASKAANMPTSSANWANSPFALGTPMAQTEIAGASSAAANAGGLAAPEAEVISAAEAARRQKMEKLGYMLPPDYYRKDLASLKKLAQAGDGFAMMHLGERYYFELNGQPQHPDYDAKLDYRELARQEFMASLVAGKVRPAGIISELYLQEHNVVDAYAWHLLSDKLGDSISADWFRRTRDYQTLTENDKQLALTRLTEIQNRLNQLAKQNGSTMQF